MRHKLRIFLASALALSSCTPTTTKNVKKDHLSIDPAKHGSDTKLVIPNESYKLKNGLTVILSVDRSSPFVATSVWYKVGAIDEQPKKTGLAHLFEHLMFEGSAHVKNDMHFRTLESIGAFSLNATTNFDRTNYYETVPKNQIETVLALESSRMFFLDINQAKLDEQRAVVRREREQRYETTPYGLASIKLWQSIFPKNHPMHGLVIGSHRDIENASLTDVKNFYQKFYGPSNATLAIVGDFEPARVKALIEKYFASLPQSQPMTPASIPPIKLGAQEIIRFSEKLARLPLIGIRYLTPGLFEPGDAELDIISHILSGGEQGRLIKALTRDQRLASSASAFQQSFERISVFSIDVILNPAVKESDALKAIDDVLLGLLMNPPSAQEIDSARNAILTHHFFGLQELGGGSGKAEILQSYNRFAHDPNFIQNDLARYQAVDQKSIVEAVKKYLPIGKNRTILEAIPEAQNVGNAHARKERQS
jgi:predicted Zn-dependent peptidase